MNLTGESEFAPSPSLGARVRAFFGLDAGKDADVTPGVLSNLRAAVSARRRGLTYLISVQARSSSAEVAARIANSLAQNYIKEQVSAKIGSTELSRDILTARILDARANMATADSDYASYLRGGSVAETQSYDLQQSARLARSQYQTLRARAGDLDVQAALQIADSRIVSPALPPTNAAFPNIRTILLLAGIAGLGLGVSSAFLYENYVGGFTSERQVEDILRARLVSSVPKQKETKLAVQSPADVVVGAPLSSFSEAIRRIRAGIDQRVSPQSGDAEARVLLVASTAPGEGKTTIALCLARSYALAGKKTLLIDGDLRTPSVHRALGVQPDHGLFELLSSGNAHVNVQSVIREDPLTKATALLGARRSAVPTDQLVSDVGFERLIKAARSSFDVVIIDSPPLGPVIDGLYIAQLADAVIFVVKWGSTAQQDVRKAVALLRGSLKQDLPILTVLNEEAVTRRSDHYRYSHYFTEPT